MLLDVISGMNIENNFKGIQDMQLHFKVLFLFKDDLTFGTEDFEEFKLLSIKHDGSSSNLIKRQICRFALAGNTIPEKILLTDLKVIKTVSTNLDKIA
jgi:hypothetical protein